MSGYLDGASPEANDLHRMAEHIQGLNSLSGVALKRADLNGDGDVDIADLSLMRRAIYEGLTLPLTPLQLSAPDISFARPGGVVELEVYNLNSSSRLEALLILDSLNHSPDIASVTPVNDAQGQRAFDIVSITLPASLSTTDDNERFAEVRLFSDNQLSNSVQLRIIDAPRIDGIERITPGSDDSIRIKGEGFGSPRLVVRLGTNDIGVIPIDDNTLEIVTPNYLQTEVAIFAIRDGHRSNPAIYLPLVSYTVQVFLPINSSLSFDQLFVFAPDGQRIQVEADGRAEFQSDKRSAGTVEVVDNQDKVILQAYFDGAELLGINARSTALLLIYNFIKNIDDDEEMIRTLLMHRLPSLTETVLLESAISDAHSQYPQLEEQIESVNAVRSALTAAIVSAQHLRREGV